jgi:Anticodon binding domain
MNGKYIARMLVEDLTRAVEPLLIEAGLVVPDSREYFIHLLELLRPRAKRLTDFVALARPFLVDTVEYEQDAVDKHLFVTGPRSACGGARHSVTRRDTLR